MSIVVKRFCFSPCLRRGLGLAVQKSKTHSLLASGSVNLMNALLLFHRLARICMDVVVPVLVHMSGVTMVEFWLRFIKLHYSPANHLSQGNLGNLEFKYVPAPARLNSEQNHILSADQHSFSSTCIFTLNPEFAG